MKATLRVVACLKCLIGPCRDGPWLDKFLKRFSYSFNGFHIFSQLKTTGKDMSNVLSLRCNDDAHVYLQGYPTSKTIANSKKIFSPELFWEIVFVFLVQVRAVTNHSTAGNTLHALLSSIENEKTSGYFLIGMFTVWWCIGLRQQKRTETDYLSSFLSSSLSFCLYLSSFLFLLRDLLRLSSPCINEPTSG